MCYLNSVFAGWDLYYTVLAHMFAGWNPYTDLAAHLTTASTGSIVDDLDNDQSGVCALGGRAGRPVEKLQECKHTNT